MDDVKKTQVVEQCIGCREIDGDVCGIFYFPDKKWRIGNCPMASHVKKELSNEIKKFLDPLKASKKKAKGRK